MAGDKLVVVGKGQLLVPPLYVRCLDWNSPEHSLVGFALETEKVCCQVDLLAPHILHSGCLVL